MTKQSELAILSTEFARRVLGCIIVTNINKIHYSMKKIAWIIVVVIIVALGVSFFGSSAKNSTKETGPIKIGFIAPLTGDAASYGQNAKSAVEIAVDEVNKSGGVNGRQIEVVYEDGKCSGAGGTSAAQKLVNTDKVQAILGGLCSGESVAGISVAKEAKVPMLSGCSSAPSLTGVSEYFFRNYPSDSYQGSFAADYLYNKLGKKNVAVLYAQSDWGNGIEKEFTKSFKALGGNIVAEESVVSNAKDYRTSLSKIKSLKPDAIYFLGYAGETVPALKQITELGIKTTIFGGDSWADPKMYADAGVSSEGIMFAAPSVSDNPEFKAKMKAKTGTDAIEGCSPTAYDALNILAQAMKNGVDSESIKAGLKNIVYTGGVVSDKISFDEKGDLMGAKYSVKVVKNGVAVEVAQ